MVLVIRWCARFTASGQLSNDSHLHPRAVRLFLRFYFFGPIFAAVLAAPFAGLPANPFLTKIVGNKCECPAPQVCSA